MISSGLPIRRVCKVNWELNKMMLVVESELHEAEVDCSRKGAFWLQIRYGQRELKSWPEHHRPRSDLSLTMQFASEIDMSFLCTTNAKFEAPDNPCVLVKLSHLVVSR
jgi:hypothetical protein